MTLDRRLRQDLTRAASDYSPPTEARLGEVLERGRRSRARRRVALVGLAAASVVLLGMAVAFRPDPDTSVQVASPAPTEELAGRYVAGEWVMELGVDGSIRLQPPAGSGLPEGTWVYSAESSSFRTNAFVDGPCAGTRNGSYDWSLDADRLTFVRTSDACDERVTALTAAPWQRG